MAKGGKAIELISTKRRYERARVVFKASDIDGIIRSAQRSLPGGLVEVETYALGSVTKHMVERRQALLHELERVAMAWDFELDMRGLPAKRDLADAFAEIGKCTEALQKALGFAWPQISSGDPSYVDAIVAATLPVWIRIGLKSQAIKWAKKRGNCGILDVFRPEVNEKVPLPPRAFDAVFESILYLGEWAKMAHEKNQELYKESTRRGRPKNVALDELFTRLRLIWRRIWERAPRVGGANLGRQHGGAPGGPFFRFCRAVVDHMHIKITDDSIRDRIRSATRKRRMRRGGKLQNVSLKSPARTSE